MVCIGYIQLSEAMHLTVLANLLQLANSVCKCLWWKYLNLCGLLLEANCGFVLKIVS